MRHFSKIPSTVFAIALILVFLTGCKPEQVVKVVETVREVPVEVIKEVPKEVTVIKEVPVEVIKEVEVPGEPVIKEVIKEVPVPVEPEEENLQEELIKIFNDSIGPTNSYARSFHHDLLMDAKANRIAPLVKSELSPNTWDLSESLTAVTNLLIDKNNPHYYFLSYFKNPTYSSNYYNNIKKKYLLLQEIGNHKVEIYGSVESEPQPYSAAQVGFATVTAGLNEYTLVLFEFPATSNPNPDPDI